MENTVFVGKVRLDFDQLPSTNDYLQEMASKSNPPEGLMVIAAKQSKGKGQHGSHWFTGEGANLATSFLFRPSFVRPDQHFLLTQTFALAVLDVLTLYAPEGFALKWPNDLYYSDKKIGGMLIETAIQGRGFSHCTLGLGLNINQHFFPCHLPNPISLFQIIKGEIEKEKLVVELCKALEIRYLQLRRGENHKIQLAYHHNLYLLDKKSAYLDVDQKKTFWAYLRGVDPLGCLVLEKMDGQKIQYRPKEIRFL